MIRKLIKILFLLGTVIPFLCLVKKMHNHHHKEK